MNRLNVFLWGLLLVVLCFACKEEEIEVVKPRQHVLVLFTPGGLGDRSYNDLILRGLQSTRELYEDVDINLCNPESMEEAERIFTDWLKLKEVKEPSLLILAAVEYEEMAARHLKGKQLEDPNKSILLFETANKQELPVSYFRLPMYGASFLAGYAAAQCSDNALILLGNRNDAVIQEAADGFRDGYEEAGKSTETESLADDWRGFVMAKEAYQMMFDWSKVYDFIYPIAGGSNMGVYRYLREFPTLFTAGMDVDQSGFSSRIIGSMIKRMDTIIVGYVVGWLKDKKMPETTFYGLEKESTDWLVAPNYEDQMGPIVEKMRAKAIQKEKEYYENK